MATENGDRWILGEHDGEAVLLSPANSTFRIQSLMPNGQWENVGITWRHILPFACEAFNLLRSKNAAANKKP